MGERIGLNHRNERDSYRFQKLARVVFLASLYQLGGLFILFSGCLYVK